MSRKIEIKYIGSIILNDNIRVNIYRNPHMDDGIIKCSWGMRNTDNSYQGIMYMDEETGIISYPNDIVITEQTDGEILPNVVVIGNETLDEHFASFLRQELLEMYKMRNKK